MIGRNFIIKSAENFFELNAKNSSENTIPFSRNRKKTAMISLNYDVNDRVNSKLKSV